MEKIIGKTFRNTMVNIDFSEYEKCSFINCSIHTDTGQFGKITSCDFTDCKLSLGEPAKKIAELIRMFYPDTPFWIEGLESKEQVLRKMKSFLEKEGVI
jgi:hypothetical protein